MGRGWSGDSQGGWAGAREFEALGARPVAWSESVQGDAGGAFRAADVIVQATSAV